MKMDSPYCKSKVPYHKLLPGEKDALNLMECLAADSSLSWDDKRNLVGDEPKKRCGICQLLCLTLVLLAVAASVSISFVLLKAYITDLPIVSVTSDQIAPTSRPFSVSDLRPAIHPPLPPLPADPRRLAKCPSIDLFKCDSSSHADYTLDAIKVHQFRIDEALAEELLEEAEKLPIFYNLPVAHDIRAAFKKCIAPDSRIHQSQLMVKTLSSVQERFGFQSSFFNRRRHNLFRTKVFSPANFSRLIGHLQAAMGISAIFDMDVQASDTMQQPFAIYLKVNYEGMQKSLFIQEFIRSNSKGMLVGQSIASVVKAISELKSTCVAVSRPLEYEKWALRSINRRWSELDFPEYFRSLAEQEGVQPQLREFLEDSELEFFIENPDCFTALNDLLRSKGMHDRHTFVANLITYLTLASKSEFLGGQDLDKSEESADKAFPLKSVPYRLKCVTELRQNVPHFMGKLYSEVLEHRERYKENVTALKSSFHLYYRSLMRAFLEFVEQTEGFKQAFALEKLRNVGVTHGAPDWLNNIEKMHKAHNGLRLDSIALSSYSGIQMELQRFAFLQKLHQLTDEDEYNRQRPFQKLCSATVQMSYSRAGNWLQIPLGILTLPHLKLDKVLAFKITNLFKYSTVGRQLISEVSKAIDSDGKWWFADGLFRSIDKFGPGFSLQNTEECYRNQLFAGEEQGQEEVDADKHIQQAINDIFGVTVSMDHLKQQYMKEMVGEASAKLVLEAYFKELRPYYCSLGHHNNNDYDTKVNEHQLILKETLRSLMLENQLFGCTDQHLKFNTNKCQIHFDEDDGLAMPDGVLYDDYQ